jgi:polyferredoxin
LTLRRLRRLSQALFLVLFVLLLCKTEYRSAFQPGDPDYCLPHPVRIFLESDPFVAITNALATRALYRGLLWSLVILIPALFLGRFFCGWICPLGTLNQLASGIRSERKTGRRRIDSNRYKPWQAFKYYLLFALLAAALLGSALGGIFDPITLAVRSFALSFLPAWSYALGHSGPLGALLSSPQEHFRQGFLLGVILIVILALNLRITRFWCRALCPLGALLGLASRWSILGLEKRRDHCEDCNRCLLHCQGGDDPIPGAPWRKPECHLCMNCVADCPESGIRFRFFAWPSTTTAAVDLKRRKVLTGVAAGAIALPLLRANTGLSAEPHERRIRPPAALDEPQFLARCIRCGECMKVCPSNALQPALSEAGWEGLWTPVLAPRVGYCEPSSKAETCVRRKSGRLM